MLDCNQPPSGPWGKIHDARIASISRPDAQLGAVQISANAHAAPRGLQGAVQILACRCGRGGEGRGEEGEGDIQRKAKLFITYIRFAVLVDVAVLSTIISVHGTTCLGGSNTTTTVAASAAAATALVGTQRALKYHNTHR